MRNRIFNRHILEVMIHVFCWILFLGFPILLTQRANGHIDWDNFRRLSVVPLSLFAIFYLNYFLLIPKVLFKEHKNRFICINIVLIILMSLLLRVGRDVFFPPPPVVNEMVQKMKVSHAIIILRDIASMIFSVGLSVSIRLSIKWDETEKARKEAVKIKTEAELKNLRSQLNPHFLLNTLNNIYALTAFDTEKAQKAIQELSKMLRYVLYDNQHSYVPLCKEIEFIRNYISLMSIRVAENVVIKTDIQVHENSQTPIVPLLFISLIENAFKHGISPVKESFITIRIEEAEDRILCEIKNSYYPKSDTDKSGSGIGLQQVKQRLELMYPGKYVWETHLSDDQKVYLTSLTLYTRSQTRND